MIPYDIDPTLHADAPAPLVLDDGFSPPTPRGSAAVAPVPNRLAQAAAQVQHA